MATEEHLLPPACAFAVSVLEEYKQDPDAVPEEAVEAAQHHMATCPRCVAAQASQRSAASASPVPRKKKRLRRLFEDESNARPGASTLLEERPSAAVQEQVNHGTNDPVHQEPANALTLPTASAMVEPVELANDGEVTEDPGDAMAVQSIDGILDCQQCRQFLVEYAEAQADGQPVAALYPEVHEHLLRCDMGCLVLLDLFKQEAKANRKLKRRPVRDPFSAIGWELSGFFRSGQVPMSPKALAYGTLLLLLLVASLGTLLGFSWNESRYHSGQANLLPTPDGVGLSDGLKVFDACNASTYQNKRDAAQALLEANVTKADSLFNSALHSAQSNAAGCNMGEAAIYQEDLHVRRSGHPFSVVVVGFDSTAGDANPTGGNDRHALYAAGTKELVGASIAQQQYNLAQMQTPGAPLLYLILANTTGVESGTSQIANSIVSLAQDGGYKQAGLLIDDTHPLLAVLGLGPGSFIQNSLPSMCRAGVPVIAPTISDPALSSLLTQTSLYNHCAPGFGFVRLASDDRQQTGLASSFAYTKLKARAAAVIYNPDDAGLNSVAQSFIDNFSRNDNAHIVARETTATGSPASGSGDLAQSVHESISAALADALKAKPRPDIIFASVQTSDAYVLAQEIARLPQNQQPVLMVGGQSVRPETLQGLAQWAHQNQFTQPHIYLSVAAAVQPKVTEAWQKQFYASFCSNFTAAGNSCSSADALDQGALLFADGLESIVTGMGPISDNVYLPTRQQLVQKLKTVRLNGVSGPIILGGSSALLITNQKAAPVLLNIQDDGHIQLVGKG